MTTTELINRLTDLAMNNDDEDFIDLIKETIDRLDELDTENHNLKYEIHDMSTEIRRQNIIGRRICC